MSEVRIRTSLQSITASGEAGQDRFWREVALRRAALEQRGVAMIRLSDVPDDISAELIRREAERQINNDVKRARVS